MDDLRGKVALVTGSAKGLGKGIALILAQKGADIILNDLTFSAEVEEQVENIQKIGRSCYFIKANVTIESEVREMFELIYEKSGRLDILVNNAGTDRPQDIFSTSLEDWNFIMQTNVTSCFLCAKYAMELMKKNEDSRIVNVSSVSAHQGALKGHVHYASSKSAMLGLTKTLARTGAEFGIRVNAIAPGVIETELSKATHGEAGMKKLSASIPLGLGTVTDVGLAVAFLCGAGSRYITGITLDVNGGIYFR